MIVSAKSVTIGTHCIYVTTRILYCFKGNTSKWRNSYCFKQLY